MIRPPALLCAAILLAAGPAGALLVTTVFSGSLSADASFSGILTYDTEAPLGLHAPPYDPVIGLDITFVNDRFFGDSTVSSNDDLPFRVEVSDTALSAAARPFLAGTAITVGLRDGSGTTFTEGVLPTSLSHDDLDEAFLFSIVQIGNQRVDVVYPIVSLRTIPEPASAALLALGLAALGGRRRRQG